MQGKLLVRTERAVLMKAEGQRMIIRDENYFTDKYELTRTHSGSTGSGESG